MHLILERKEQLVENLVFKLDRVNLMETKDIRQFEGGLTKDHAECLALLDVIDMYPKEATLTVNP